ncbi:MAG: hypothetical protein WCJ61_05825 [Paludibacter sp.]
MQNVANKYPDRVAQMVAEYDKWAKRCQVEPAPQKNPNADE